MTPTETPCDHPRMKPLPRFLWRIGALRAFHDGNSCGWLFRPWHPVSWLVGPTLFLIMVLLEGVPEAWRHRSDIGLGLSPYWQARRHDIRWIPAFRIPAFRRPARRD